VSDDELIEVERTSVAGQRWIVDSDDVDEDLLVAHADTLVVITTRWWVCSWRAFRHGLRRPAETQLPEGCEEPFSQRIRDEWGIAWRNWSNRTTVPENDRRRVSGCVGVAVDASRMSPTPARAREIRVMREAEREVCENSPDWRRLLR
jgi:hypothetical protein